MPDDVVTDRPQCRGSCVEALARERAAGVHHQVARRLAEDELDHVRARLEALIGHHEVRYVRLCDLHARFHGRDGDLLERSRCGNPGCGFWDAGAFILDALSTDV